MDATERKFLASQLYEALMGRMHELFVLSRLFEQPLDQAQLVQRMEADLQDQLGKVGTYLSVYSDEEVAERKTIAVAVVARIGRDFARA